MNPIIENKGFEIRGHWIPPFKLGSGKLIRIYIPNFSMSNQLLGFDLAQELAEIFMNSRPEKGLAVKGQVPYARDYSQNLFAEKIFPLTVAKYLTGKLKVEKDKAKCILAQLGISECQHINETGFTDRKCLTISGLFYSNYALLFDYYGSDAMSMRLIDKLIKSELDKGKCAVGFDNLQYMEDKEPFENVERVIIKAADTKH